MCLSVCLSGMAAGLREPIGLKFFRVVGFDPAGVLGYVWFPGVALGVSGGILGVPAVHKVPQGAGI